MLTVLIIVLLILLLGGVPAYYNREAWGPAPGGILGLLILIILIVLILRLAGVWV